MHRSKHMHTSSTRGWVKYRTFNTGLCTKETNSKEPPKMIKQFPALSRGIGERVSVYPLRKVTDLGEGTERKSYRVQDGAKECQSRGRPCWRWKAPSPSPAPCSEVNAARHAGHGGTPLPFRPAPDLRAPQGHRASGHSEEDSKDRHGQTRTALEEGLDQAPAGSRAAPRSRRGPARPPGLPPEAAAAKP